jgi:parallel beta-helix repeat protein
MKKTIAILLTILMVFSLFQGVLRENVVKAQEQPIYVPDDYSTIQAAVNAANPGDTIIVRDGTYTENVDVNKDYLTIKSENGAEATIVQAANSGDHVFEVTADYVDISGFTVTGAIGAAGIRLHGSYSDKIEYCDFHQNIISNNYVGIWLFYSLNNNITDNAVNSNKSGIAALDETCSNNSITRNDIHSNAGAGIDLFCSSWNKITENSVYSNGDGILISTSPSPYSSGYNELMGNHIYSNNNYGIYLRSKNCKLANNTIENNKYNFGMGGIVYNGLWSCYWDNEYYIQDIDTSNTINGKPIYYILNKKNLVIDSTWDIGYLAVVNSENITIKNIEVKNNEQGILIAYTTNSTIENITAMDNYDGIRLDHCSNNTIAGGNISNNDNSGITLVESSDNTIIEATINGNGTGICLASICNPTDNNIVSRNNILNNSKGICLEGSQKGNVIYNNLIKNNTIGIDLQRETFGEGGGTIQQLTGDIYLNNFINNTDQVYSSYSIQTGWNSSEKITYAYNGKTYMNYLGNYWSDYTGSDANGDGIGDAPYSIDSDGDNYPLMEKFENYVVGAADTTPPAAVTDLRVAEVTADSVTLTWTAPGNDGNIGTATTYDIRYVTLSINEDNWSSATQVDGEPPPKPAGTTEGFTVTGLSSSTTYYFALKTADEVSNWSALSNVLSATTSSLVPSIMQAWTSDSVGGPEVIEFPAGTKKIYVNYVYESATGSIHKVIYYDNEGKVLGSYEHTIEHGGAGTGTWGLGYPHGDGEIWPEGSYHADLFINDILLASVSWTVAGPAYWSFAIITDLHIGRGYPDYGGEGIGIDVEDINSVGQDYYLTERLKKAVEWINDNKTKYNFKFVVVLGDISDSGEYSELKKAKNILDNLEIPYVPVIGNHDIWPYTDEEEFNPSYLRYFEPVFRDAFEKLANNPDFNFEWQPDRGDLVNYRFTYNGMRFIVLDCVSREHVFFGHGVWPGAVLHDKTKEWLNQSLLENEPAVIFSHHPITLKIPGFIEAFEGKDLEDIARIIQDKNSKVWNFAGHVHGYNKFLSIINQDIYDVFMDANKEYIWPVGWYENQEYTQLDLNSTTTEALMVGENEIKPEGAKGIIRIVNVRGKDIEYEAEKAEGEFLSLNPYLYLQSAKERGIGDTVKFEISPFQRGRTFKYALNWDDGKPLSEGTSSTDALVSHTYTEAGTYTLNLTVRDINDTSLMEYITQNITIKEGARKPYKTITSAGTTAVTLNGADLSENPQNTPEWGIIFERSEPKPVAQIYIHFENAIDNIDLSDMVAKTNLTERKSIIYMNSWPSVIEPSKILYIPSTGKGTVYICKNAKSLEEVKPENADVVINVGETKDGMTLGLTEYEGEEYYVVYGVTGTGGGEVTSETHTITSSAGLGGTISPSGTVTVNYGESKTFTITPDTGYHIKDVLVNGVSVGAVSTYTFTNVIANYMISAIFAINTCTLTIGYWKTHAGFTGKNPDKVTSLLPISMGSITVTSTSDAVRYLSMNGDALNGINKLLAQLLGAKLNIENGADGSAVSAVISAADSFLTIYGPSDWDSLSDSERQQVLSWMSTLDDYNNGLIGPGHCP